MVAGLRRNKPYTAKWTPVQKSLDQVVKTLEHEPMDDNAKQAINNLVSLMCAKMGAAMMIDKIASKKGKKLAAEKKKDKATKRNMANQKRRDATKKYDEELRAMGWEAFMASRRAHIEEVD